MNELLALCGFVARNVTSFKIISYAPLDPSLQRSSGLDNCEIVVRPLALLAGFFRG